MSFLLDTNVVSDLRRRARARPALAAWFDAQAAGDLFLSVVTIGEIRQGVDQLRRRDPRQAHVLDDWLSILVREYADRLLPIDVAVAEEWGRLRAIRTVPVVDALLAATARIHDLTLVTRNDADFRGLEVRTLDPSRA